jgi:formylglycine-generating enzyme required for sulfatase activity
MKAFALPLLALPLLGMAQIAHAQDTALQVKTEQIEGPACAHIPTWQDNAPPRPCHDSELAAWLQDARHWRDERRVRTGLNDTEYRDPALSWTQTSFIQPQMMVQDRFFYDPIARHYTVGRYLDDLTQRYGGIDSVLVWPTYPNIGIDDRNQYDLLADLPGGIAGLRAFVKDFHDRGVKVLFPTMLWDRGTRQQGTADALALAGMLAQIGADGINGDTLDGVPHSFRDASKTVGHPLALEPELTPASDEMLGWNTMSWGYWDYGFTPVLSRAKWLEPRHLVHVSNRFNHDHTDDLQNAFFNGTGFESWENVWGIWNGLTPRDAEALRRMAAVERLAGSFLTAPDWQPFAPTLRSGIFASRWPRPSGTLWTLVNRNHYDVDGRQLALPHRADVHYIDLWHGEEIQPSTQGDRDILSFAMDADGFGALLVTDHLTQPLLDHLKTMKAHGDRLSSYSRQWQPLPQRMIPIAPSPAATTPPPGMSHVPEADFAFRVNGIEIEGGNDEGVDVQYPQEASARRYHDLSIHIPAFWIDTVNVTNAAFQRFLDATHYRPADDHNFLKDWVGGHYPAGWADKPVTWVSLEDARAYASWAGKRLPHEWEWQYAAQGTDGRNYPWGNDAVAANMPTPDRGRSMAPPADVGAHPGGASPFGVLDLVGNVWQWTDEWQDDHTSAAILRGGSHYQPQGARWYFPQAYLLSQHGKYLLMAPGMDRSGAVGFRCVKDAG